MNCIIFSRDRAMQCCALIESIKANLSVFRAVEVVYTTKYPRSYEKLIKAHPDVSFIPETNFWSDVIGLVGLYDAFTCLMVDDCIVYRHDPDVQYMYMHYPIVSLRLGMDIRVKEHFDYKGSLDGNIFSSSLLLSAIKNRRFINPNKLEIILQRELKHEQMGTLEHSIVKGIPANKVSSTSSCSDMGISAALLDKMWMDGCRLRWEDMNLNHHNVHKDVNLLEYIT